MREE
ncbi:hypothetical protein R3I93_018119 [Phoxinus phoxinus]|jgi:hypothetical protein